MSVVKSLVLPEMYTKILSRFPQNLSFCFAYGSGVKTQLTPQGNSSKQNMIDLIYCVDDSEQWHQANMLVNRSHYSALKYLGPRFIARFQENFGANLYFNPLVRFDDKMIKYGVVATKDLITDLLEWSHLYLAGRLHKPVEIIKYASDAELLTALQLNLQSAVHAALLVLPETFTEYEFYYTISNLSYSGDFRMTFGESKNKVESIVKPQMAAFRQLYRPLLVHLQDYIDFPMMQRTCENVEGKDNPQTTLNSERVDANQCSQDICALARLHHLNQLPRWPQKALTRLWNRGSVRQDTEDVLRAIAYDPECDVIVRKCIADIVWKSSIRQALKGIVTAGIVKSIKYSGRKVMKMLN